MSASSNIEWCDSTWPVVTGCDKVSPGCQGCYAIRDGWRLSHNPNPAVRSAYDGTVRKTAGGALNWTGLVRPLPERLDWPLRWKKPRRVFVCNQSDLFHEDVPDVFILSVFTTMRAAGWHTFQILTKRAARMQSFAHRLAWRTPTAEERAAGAYGFQAYLGDPGSDPLPNIWLGVSAENQEYADERIPLLLQTPATVRFVSAEPLIGPIDFNRLHAGGEVCSEGCGEKVTYSAFHASAHCGCCVEGDEPVAWHSLNWVIVGGESGPGRRPIEVAWVRSIVEQCRDAGVPVFVKQDSGPRPGLRGRIPDELWVREFPEAPR